MSIYDDLDKEIQRENIQKAIYGYQSQRSEWKRKVLECKKQSVVCEQNLAEINAKISEAEQAMRDLG